MKRKTMRVKQPQLRATEKLGKQVAKFMAQKAASIASGAASNPEAPGFENDQPPAWVSKLAKDAADRKKSSRPGRLERYRAKLKSK